MSTEVKLYVYDLSGGMAKQMSMGLIGKQIDGIWHTAIVVFGREYFFGSEGISDIAPGTLALGPPTEVINLGNTTKTKEAFEEYIKKQSKANFKGEKYDLFKHNCNNFSNESSKFLVGKPIPSHIISLPSDVLNSPFGPFIKPFIDQLGSIAPGSSQGRPNTQLPNKKKDKNNHASKKSQLQIFNDNLGDQTFQSISMKTNADGNQTEQSLAAQELFQYASNLPLSGDSWGIGPFHISLLDEVDSDSAVDFGIAIVDCFRFTVCHSDDVLLALLSERNHCLSRLLERIGGNTESLLINGILKLLCNCIHRSYSWSLDNETRLPSNLIVDICVQCLEKENNRTEALALAKNIAFTLELSEEEALHLGSYLIYLCSEKELISSKDTRNCLWETVHELLSRYPDLVELGKAHELYLEDIDICQDIKTLLDLD